MPSRPAAEDTQELPHASTPVFFPAGPEERFGIFTRPAATPNGITMLLLAGWSRRGIVRSR